MIINKSEANLNKTLQLTDIKKIIKEVKYLTTKKQI
jgi:hypothetical protein